MSHLLRKLSLALVVGGFSLAFAACETAYGESCSMPDAQQITLACAPGEGTDGNAAGTCVYRTSPECESGMCATHLSSPSFCTQSCEVTEDCPADSACVMLADGSGDICVPNSHME